jgi:hypothetical protein
MQIQLTDDLKQITSTAGLKIKTDLLFLMGEINQNGVPSDIADRLIGTLGNVSVKDFIPINGLGKTEFVLQAKLEIALLKNLFAAIVYYFHSPVLNKAVRKHRFSSPLFFRLEEDVFDRKIICNPILAKNF